MRVLAIGDVHLSDRPPSIRTDTYTDDILTKLSYIVQLAATEHCDVIVQAGDMFHLKTASRNSHALVQRTAEILTAADIPVLVVPGNHDLSNDRLDSIKKQPLGTLVLKDGIDLLIGAHPEFPLFGLPYLSDWAGDLPKWMSKYRNWCIERKMDDLDFWPLMVTHAPIFPSDESPPYDFIHADDWAGLMGVGDFYWGHIHDPNGDIRPDPALPVWGCNQGAISRGSIHEKTLKREPAVTIWDSQVVNPTGSHFTRFPVPHRPAEAVFRLAEKEDVDEKTNRVEEFLSAVGSTSLDGLSLEEVASQAQARGLAPRTLQLIHELLESVS